MLIQFFTRLIDIIAIGLDPFEPISLDKPGWHLLHPLVADVGLERIHAFVLEICDVVPAVVHAADVFRFLVRGHLVLPVHHEIVSIDRWDGMCVLLVIKRIVRVLGVGIFDRLFELFKVLLVGPFMVKVACSILLLLWLL